MSYVAKCNKSICTINKKSASIFVQLAADAENADNTAEQRRQLGKRVRYGDIMQVRFLVSSVLKFEKFNSTS